jgi:hypothetical protein
MALSWKRYTAMLVSTPLLCLFLWVNLEANSSWEKIPMKTLKLTNAEAKWLKELVGKTKMGDNFYSVYAKLAALEGEEE